MFWWKKRSDSHLTTLMFRETSPWVNYLLLWFILVPWKRWECLFVVHHSDLLPCWLFQDRGEENNLKAFQLFFFFFFKLEELPGALSQNRGLERKAVPLPADELILPQVKRLQTNAEGLPSEKLTVLRVGHPNEACKQNMEDNFPSLDLYSCCISMKYLLQRLQSTHSCEAAQFPSGIPAKFISSLPFSPRNLIVAAYLLRPKLNY